MLPTKYIQLKIWSLGEEDTGEETLPCIYDAPELLPQTSSIVENTEAKINDPYSNLILSKI